jgi:hypothetical protein
VIDHHPLSDPTEIGTDLGLPPSAASPQTESLLIEKPKVSVLNQILTFFSTQPNAEAAHRSIDPSGKPTFETPDELPPGVRLEGACAAREQLADIVICHR